MISKLIASAWDAFATSRQGEALRLARRAVDESAAASPDRAASLGTLARLLDAIGDTVAAEPLYREAVELDRRLAPEDPERARSLTKLARLLRERGAYDEGRALLDEALGLLSADGSDPAAGDIARTVIELARLVHDTGDPAGAGELGRFAEEIVTTNFDSDDAERRFVLGDLASLYLAIADYERAEATATVAAESTARTLGRRDPAYAEALDRLGSVHTARADYASAERELREASELRREGDPVTYARSLHNLAALLVTVGRYDEAEEPARQAVEIFAERLGRDHPMLVRPLSNLAWLAVIQGRRQDARRLYGELLTLIETQLGERHPDYADVLNHLARLDEDDGDLGAAEDRLRLAHKLSGGVDPEITAHLAAVVTRRGHFDEARALYDGALAVAEETVGPVHPIYATCLGNLGGLLSAIGDYTGAEAHHRRAAEIIRATLDDRHPDLATELDHLAFVTARLGRYDEAAAQYREALDIKAGALRRNDPSWAVTAAGLATVELERGRYREAGRLIREALAVLGADHPEFAAGLARLGDIYEAMGDADGAEPLFRNALDAARATRGPRHRSVGSLLNNLAGLIAARDRAAAEPVYREAVEVMRDAIGPRHPDYALALANLAWVHDACTTPDVAEREYREALEVLREAFDPAHPALLPVLRNLGLLLAATGRRSEARTMLNVAATSARQRLGDRHAELGLTLDAVAMLEVADGRGPAALDALREAAAITDAALGELASLSSERQRLVLLNGLWRDLELAVALALMPSAPAGAGAVAADAVLRRKGIGAEVLSSHRDAALSGRHPEVRDQLATLAGLRAQIARRTLDGPGPEGLQAHDTLLAQWDAEREALERTIASALPTFRAERERAPVSTARVAAALPDGAALVEIVRATHIDFDTFEWLEPHYVALILSAAGPDEVPLVDLGEAERIDALVAEVREAISGSGRHVGEEHPVAATALTAACAALAAAVLTPWLDSVGDARRLFVAPDGELTRIPFEILPTPDGRLTIETYDVSYLTTGRDLLRLAERRVGAAGEALVIAAPNYDLELRPHAPEPAAPADVRRSHALTRDLRFGPLAGAAAEGQAVGALLGVPVLTGDAALERRLKQRRSPRILHIATHGYFLPDAPSPSGPGAPPPRLGLADRFLGAGAENPLLRSGLALAGANTRLRGGSLPAAAEDGLFNAEDAAALDLDGTELVVLSACDTGLGAVRTGEGVFGLRRAFALAGARTLVTSLWKVPDDATRELMERFYRALLRGAARTDALREARLALRARRGGDVSEWGAFICVGEPGPLTGSPREGP